MPTTSFWVYFLLFSIVSVFSFSIPGVFLVNRIQKLGSWEKLIFGSVLGFVLFTLASYIFLLIGIPLLIIPTVLIADACCLKIFVSLVKRMSFPPKKQFIVLLLIFLLGTLGQLAIIAPSGRAVNGELVFWSAHGHDGAWHIASMNEIGKGWPLQNPAFAGEKLVNYHFFSDIAPAFFQKYLGFSSLDLYFRFFPFLYSILFGATAYLLGKRLGKSFSAGLWSYVFIIFGGSFGYIVTLLQQRGVGGESIFWATQPQSSIGNPPQIVSNIIVLSFFYFLSFYEGLKKKIVFAICAILAGVLVVFKVYAGVVVLAALFLSGFWQLAIAAGAISALLYFPNTSGSTSFLIFQPWWFIRTMVVEPSRLNWIDLELRRQFYLDRGGWRSILRIIEYESVAFFIFFLGNLGTRVVGLIEVLKSSRVLVLTIVISFLAPLLFLQKGVASNTNQFLQYFVLLFGLLAGLSVAKIMNKLKSGFVKIILTALIVALSVPTQVALLYDFYSRPAFAKINQEELSALNKIKESYPKDTVILTPAYNKYTDLKMTTPDIWDWFDTAYVSAFSAKRTYLADTEQVDIMGYDFKERLAFQEKIFSEPSALTVAKQMKEKGLTILYFPKALAPKAEFDEKYFERIIENRRVEVWIIK